MNSRKLIASLCVLGFSATSLSLHAQEMDIEQADSLNFQSFHKDKKESLKVWDKNSEPTKAYSEQTADTKPAANSGSTDAHGTAMPTDTPPKADDPKGKRFELRERYTLTRSAKTPYSAFYVIEPLYKQAAQYCAKGWKKLAERSEPIEQDYYLYYEIECL